MSSESDRRSRAEHRRRTAILNRATLGGIGPDPVLEVIELPEDFRDLLIELADNGAEFVSRQEQARRGRAQDAADIEALAVQDAGSGMPSQK